MRAERAENVAARERLRGRPPVLRQPRDDVLQAGFDDEGGEEAVPRLFRQLPHHPAAPARSQAQPSPCGAGPRPSAAETDTDDAKITVAQQLPFPSRAPLVEQ